MTFWFVCSFGVFRPTREFFTHFIDVTFAGERLKILICARHSWSLSSEAFLSVPHLLWHGTSVYHGHLRGPVYQWSWNYLFDRLGSVATGIRTTKFPHAKRTQIEIKTTDHRIEIKQLTTGLRYNNLPQDWDKQLTTGLR